MLFCCGMHPRLYQRYMCEGTGHILDILCAQTHFTEPGLLLSLQGLLKPEVLLAPSSHTYMERKAATKKEREKGERKVIT